MNSEKDWKYLAGLHLLFMILVAGTILAYRWLDISCLLRSLTGIPCPTCGGTRAMLSLLRLDFSSYWYYHPLALPLSAAFLLVFHVGKLSRWKKQIYIYTAVVIILTLILYIYRLAGNLIP